MTAASGDRAALAALRADDVADARDKADEKLRSLYGSPSAWTDEDWCEAMAVELSVAAALVAPAPEPPSDGLLPCPFCGGAPTFYPSEVPAYSTVGCTACDVELGPTAWNRRALSAAPRVSVSDEEVARELAKEAELRFSVPTGHLDVWAADTVAYVRAAERAARKEGDQR